MVTSDPAETGEEEGWIVRELWGNSHYQIGIGRFGSGDPAKIGFVVRAGGAPIFSDELTPEALSNVLDEAISCGPTHLEPPGKSH